MSNTPPTNAELMALVAQLQAQVHRLERRQLVMVVTKAENEGQGSLCIILNEMLVGQLGQNLPMRLAWKDGDTYTMLDAIRVDALPPPNPKEPG